MYGIKKDGMSLGGWGRRGFEGGGGEVKDATMDKLYLRMLFFQNMYVSTIIKSAVKKCRKIKNFCC